MKLIIIAGTPGSGKTSIIKHVIEELKSNYKLFFAKFDCLNTHDDEVIHQKTGIPAVKKLAEELCPDHYTALMIPQILKKHGDKDIIIIETAGLCLRCSPYLKNCLGINVLDTTSGNPDRYGPILDQADVVAISKGNLISQAEREIFRTRVMQKNNTAELIEIDGLTGEGALDIAEIIENAPEFINEKQLVLRHSMPSAVCGFCYGNKTISKTSIQNRFKSGQKIRLSGPMLNCGRCGFKSCNEFIRAVLDGKAETKQCPFRKNK